ncbi:hypothetical protein [Muriicola sp. Z0-33]|uniref:hypothetical protein n=1 Tax=Muriicola sp. Z0-33 TaxID=2816957 RepID=UPI002238D8E8|nr:hypothetical protein [Muriicola sp. Z0-33]MCW5517911.1 hypothetical protein [Muriicola sp. Z0-33]
MNKNKLITSIALGLLLGTGMYASEPCKAIDFCVLDSIEYIEEESDFELGFNTADYLPEDFDPHTFYFDLNSVVFLENDEIDDISSEYLPEDFDAYAVPTDFMAISYIDPADLIEPVIEVRIDAPSYIEAAISK